MSEIKIKAKDGSGQFMAYVAKPPSGKGPGIVLAQEIFGVNKVMRDLADGFAQQGYMVACADLFWRQKPGIQITDRSEAEWAQAFELYKGFNEAKGVDDLIATLEVLRIMPGSTGKAGSVGYCLGGKLAYLMATRSSVDCSVGYYGVGIENALGEAKNIKKPLMLHVAEKDQFCPPDAQAKIKAMLGANTLVTLHSYAGQDHAFARVGGEHWNQAAAELANRRTAEFLRQNLV
jgi:carboxymethylenebutenolidase